VAKPSVASIVVNAVCFQLVWFVCVALRMPWAIPAAVVAAAVWFALVRPDASGVARLLLVVALGILVDSLLTVAGVFRFTESWGAFAGVPGADGWLCPPWLMCLWIGFATTVGVSLRPLITRLPLAVILGAVAGPLAYYVGSRLGAVSFGYSMPIALGVLALVWALLLPLVNRIVNRTPA